MPRWFAFHSRISVLCPWSPTATSTTSLNRAQPLGFFRSVFPPCSENWGIVPMYTSKKKDFIQKLGRMLKERLMFLERWNFKWGKASTSSLHPAFNHPKWLERLLLMGISKKVPLVYPNVCTYIYIYVYIYIYMHKCVITNMFLHIYVYQPYLYPLIQRPSSSLSQVDYRH